MLNKTCSKLVTEKRLSLLKKFLKSRRNNKMADGRVALKASVYGLFVSLALGCYGDVWLRQISTPWGPRVKVTYPRTHTEAGCASARGCSNLRIVLFATRSAADFEPMIYLTIWMLLRVKLCYIILLTNCCLLYAVGTLRGHGIKYNHLII